MNQKVQTKSRAKAAKDPLQGAPGHAPNPEAVVSNEQGPEIKVKEGSRKTSGSEDTQNDQAFVDTALERLNSLFGAENVQKFRDLLSSKAPDAEAQIMTLIRSVTSNLPHGFTLPSLSAIASRPVRNAATVAAGVGALFLLREYLTRDTSSSSKSASKSSGNEDTGMDTASDISMDTAAMDTAATDTTLNADMNVVDATDMSLADEAPMGDEVLPATQERPQRRVAGANRNPSSSGMKAAAGKAKSRGKATKTGSSTKKKAKSGGTKKSKTRR